MSLLPSHLPLAGLLKDSGVHLGSLARIAVQRASDLLRSLPCSQSSQVEGSSEGKDSSHYDAVLQYAETLLFLLPQAGDEDTVEVAKKVVCELVDPYLTSLSSHSYFVSAANHRKLATHVQALGHLLGTLLRKDATRSLLGGDVVTIFVELFGKFCTQQSYEVPEELGKGHGVNPATAIAVLDQMLQVADPDEIERESLSLSPLFDAVMQLIQHSDLATCYRLSSLILPLLVTHLCMDRVERVWDFVVNIRRQSLHTNSQTSELILTLLCCFANFFILYTNHASHASPFSCHLPKFLSERRSPVHDLRKVPDFWSIVQEGLASCDPISRKRCMYLLQCVLVSVRGEGKRRGGGGEEERGGEEVLVAEGGVFWWSSECSKELGSAWDSLVLILETMEEKQIHIVKPVKKYLTNVISATATKSSNGLSLLHISWLVVALTRIFEHTEAKTIVCWGVEECLKMDLRSSPFLMEENWKFIFGRLLEVLNVSMIYSRSSGRQHEEPPPVVKNLASFLQRFTGCLVAEKKGLFVTKFLAAVDAMNFVEVPLVFVTFALSQLPAAPLLGGPALASIRSIIVTGILTHRPSLRAATQSFLLSIMCKLTDLAAVTYENVVQTLGVFRESECFVIGSDFCNQAYQFFAHFCHFKEVEHGSFRYFERCMRNCLKDESDPTLPSPTHLARAVVLLADGEGRRVSVDPLSVLSSATLTVGDAVSSLLSPTFEVAAEAHKRPYLSPRTLGASLEIVRTTFKLALGGTLTTDQLQRGHTNSCAGSSSDDDAAPPVFVVGLQSACTLGRLADILHHVVEQVLLGAKDDGVPDLEHVLFHVEVATLLHRYAARYCRPVLAASSCGILVAGTRRAVGVLQKSILATERVELTSAFLGAVTLLQWACLHSEPSSLPLDDIFPLVSQFPINLTLVKGMRQTPAGLGVPVLDGGGRMPLKAAERSDWGPLVTHCYAMYWQCLASFLKWSANAQGGAEFHTASITPSSRVVVGSADVTEVARCCLDNLDAAALSVGVVIESVASLLPKWILVSGSKVLLECADIMWPLVLELKNHQQPFWRALRAYLGVVFHPAVFLCTGPCVPEVLDLQHKCAGDFLELGEAKSGVYRLLVRHVFGEWERALTAVVSIRSAHGDASLGTSTPTATLTATPTSPVQLFWSLKVHGKMLVQMCTFGPVYKKNLRSVDEVEVFLESLHQSSVNATRYLDDNVSIRVKVVAFILRLAGRCSKSDEETALLFRDFLHNFVHHLLQEVADITAERRQYFINSLTHRIKLRLVQALFVTTHFVTESTAGDICTSLLHSLRCDNQLSVRYLMEWTVVAMVTRFPALLEHHIYGLLEQVQQLIQSTELRLSRMCSVFTVLMHTGCSIQQSDLKAKYYRRVLPVVLQWTSCHQCIARLYAQLTLLRMWDDCKQHDLLEEFGYIDGLASFMRSMGDGGKKVEKNVFFRKVQADLDRNVETVFYILPLLSDVIFEEAVPLKYFLSALAGSEDELEGIGFDLSCSNPDLLSALEGHLESCQPEGDGSDTRSLAHRFTTPGGGSEVPLPAVAAAAATDDVQKKISLLSNSSAIAGELFPHYVSDTVQPSMPPRSGSGLVVVASLVSKIPNQGGLCRTCEVFSAQSLLLSNLAVLEDKHFQGLSVTSERWLPLGEVKLNALREYLLSMRRSGYAIVGLEQTMRSKCASSYKFQRETVLVLGNEREGIPAEVIHLLDDCIEIPQFGMIRSLNVHVSASILIWEYTKQHLVSS